MKRRTFISLLGAAGAAVVLRRSRAAHADTFGAFPAGNTSVQLPAGVRAKQVLEVFLYGGLSPWETLYFVRNYGKPDDPDPALANTQYYALPSGTATALTSCGVADAARVFGTDALGATVELGPFASRLWDRQDVVARMRLVVQRHDLEPHEAAVPMALTGRPVGQPTAAGLGTHIQRARIDAQATPGRASPHSYVFSTNDISSDNIAAAAAAGAHPGAARPLLIKTDNAADFTRLLRRDAVGTDRGRHDALVDAYLGQHEARLTWPARGRVRSPRTDDLAASIGSIKQADAIAAVLPDGLFARRGGTACGLTRPTNLPLMGLGAARALLTHPTEPASYVCVSDTGLESASGGGGYDTHTDNARDTARNFDNVLQSLLAIINAPGEADPTKLSLDDTLIILNTEFGRTPSPQDGGNGRNHHPYGYVTAFIGGPITTGYKGISGAIGPDGRAVDGYATPSENRIAALLALGIWPFAHEGFAVSDVADATGEVDAATRAMTKFLGRTA
ncbi:MAG: DUF1501 domain-containing protein [Proteobacteria bacterium]|nr:DUF1501 domain-containing protein [Pseudomonadota bacterium]